MRSSHSTTGARLKARLISEWHGKRVTIMGLGQYRWGSGRSAAAFFANLGARVTVTDLQPAEKFLSAVSALRPYHIRYVFGHHAVQDFRNADLVVRNPVVPDRNAFLVEARKHHVPIVTDVSFFLRNCPSRVIGVTGTRGKSTTASLLAFMLKKKFNSVFLGGNIGRSPLQFLFQCRPTSLVILELSSWMLESTAQDRWSPDIAVLTNLYRDHLNHYVSYRAYVRAKALITRFQTSDDLFVYNAEDPGVRAIAKPSRARRFPFSTRKALGFGCSIKNDFISVVSDKKQHTLAPISASSLPGEHNRENILAAAAAAFQVGATSRQITQALRAFPGIPERIETIARWRGLVFVDDTTSTMPDATIAALRSVRRPIVLIAGGTDKVLDFTELGQLIPKSVRSVIFLPGTGTKKLERLLRKQRFARLFGPVQSMAEAVDLAVANAPANATILLSPGAASFGLFTNEFDRGRAFKRAVHNLMRTNR